MTLHTGTAHLREVGQKCLGLPGVKAADIRDDDQTDGAHLELTIGPGDDRVPPRVLRTLANNDCGIYSVTPRAGGWMTVLVV